MNKKTTAFGVLLTLSLAGLGDTAMAASAAATETPKLPAREAAPTPVRESASDTAAPRTPPAWQSIFVEAGRRVEIDNASVKKENDGKVQAYSRILFEKALPDATSGGTYQILEAQNNYDCEKRTFNTQRRIYRKDEKTLLREENSRSKAELPVRSGTLDEKILRVVCKPSTVDNKTAFAATVTKAKAVAEAHAPEPRKELLRTELGGAAKPAAHGSPAPKPASHGSPASKAVRKTAPATEMVLSEDSHEHIHWAYEGRGGPENWGKLNPANKLCDSGSRQSPIDIRDGIRVDLTPINFSYRPSHFRIIDNGHTIQAGVSDNRISLLGKEYELIQLHFHRPSEERVNGRNFDMVAHLVHKAYDGQLAVVAVLMERGGEHPVVQTLWNYLPLERHSDVYPPGVAIDLNQLLPDKRDYFTYMGSLTTPPCTEGVIWLVMKTPIQVSSEQIGIFSRLYPNNARPIQPQKGRLIKESR